MIFGTILELKIFTFTMMTVFVITTASAFAYQNEIFAAIDERPDAIAQWDDYSTFTTTGTATVRVVDHYMNMDSNRVETLTVAVYTEKNEDNPELAVIVTETGTDTGIFEGNVFFSEVKESAKNTLQVTDGETVSVEYMYSSIPDSGEVDIGVGQDKTIQNNPESPVTHSTERLVKDRPNAYSEWGADNYASIDTAIARVADPFMNAEPNKVETLTARIVVADNYDDGIKITLTETGMNTGIFETTISFTETGESSGNMIRVADGDDVSLDYMYSEVPDSDKREDMIEVGDETTIDNSQNADSISDTSDFGATVHLDKKVYSWTDKVYITVTSPFHNFDRNAVEEIGATQPYTIRMHTSSSDIDSYKLVETGPNTGVFTGEVTLTGFLHDADGSGLHGHLPYEDTTPMTSGNGPVDGFLENTNNDAISVQFDYSEDVTIVGYAEIQWTMGKTEWLKASYPDSATGVIRIVDPDMNWDPKAVDNFDVDVWSDSDAGGIDLTVTETNQNTGIFEGTVFFTTTDDSSGHRLLVAEGDTITAEYEDNTLPNPYTPQDELDISDTSIIRNTGVPSPYKQMQNGILVEHVTCNGALEKLYKSDGSPACVKPSSVAKLIQRGWTDNAADIVSTVNSQKQIIVQSESHAYDDLCGFPVTDEMRLKAIHDNSYRFTKEGISYFELYPGNFTHTTLAENYLPDDPHLNYWFELENGNQVYFRIGACDVDGSDTTRFEVRR